jgi:hypothetical protein
MAQAQVHDVQSVGKKSIVTGVSDRRMKARNWLLLMRMRRMLGCCRLKLAWMLWRERMAKLRRPRWTPLAPLRRPTHL